MSLFPVFPPTVFFVELPKGNAVLSNTACSVVIYFHFRGKHMRCNPSFVEVYSTMSARSSKLWALWALYQCALAAYQYVLNFELFGTVLINRSCGVFSDIAAYLRQTLFDGCAFQSALYFIWSIASERLWFPYQKLALIVFSTKK